MKGFYKDGKNMCVPLKKKKKSALQTTTTTQKNIGRFHVHGNKPEMEICSAVTSNACDGKQENFDWSYANFSIATFSLSCLFR